MIIGHGDIASVVSKKDSKNYLYFASGVSNSQETRESEYQREKDLLMKQDKTQHIIYFSSLSIFYANTRYTRHKIEMEELIKKHFKHNTIFRLGNITWGKNPHTLINFLRDKIKRGEEVEIRPVYRYIVDEAELLHWIDLLPLSSHIMNCEMNITGRRMLVEDVVKEYIYGARNV